MLWRGTLSQRETTATWLGCPWLTPGSRRRPEISYAALTSSYSHNTSTGEWTYSDSVLAGLRGEPQVDLNHDGIIELSELAQYTDLELAFLDGQKSMFFAAPTFPRAAKLADVLCGRRLRRR